MKQVINLDKDFKPTRHKSVNADKFKFPEREINLSINGCSDLEVIITHRIKSSDNLMEVLLAKNALEIRGVKDIELIIPYVPYARQDRVCNTGEAFSLKVFTDIINNANFSKVIIYDPHSDVTPALIDNCDIISNHEFVKYCIGLSSKDTWLISPDAGANKKILSLAQYLGHKNIVKCDKTRDLSTGKLSGFEVYAEDLEGKDCFIIDDICDGGGTFLGLGMELKKKNCGNLYLIVSHGIFSNGFEKLKEVFSHIYTTNSFKDIENDFVTQYLIRV